MVGHGVTQFAAAASKNLFEKTAEQAQHVVSNATAATVMGNKPHPEEETTFIREEDLEGMYIKSLGVEILQQNEDGKRYELRNEGKEKVLVIDEETFNKSVLSEMRAGNTEIFVTPAKPEQEAQKDGPLLEGLKQQLSKSQDRSAGAAAPQQQQPKLKPLSKKKPETV